MKNHYGVIAIITPTPAVDNRQDAEVEQKAGLDIGLSWQSWANPISSQRLTADRQNVSAMIDLRQVTCA